ncbi:MAG: DUF3820 family protein [Myxococcales bacterium]|nr:DUF3820 family protein [Myxococcales bacterium]
MIARSPFSSPSSARASVPTRPSAAGDQVRQAVRLEAQAIAQAAQPGPALAARPGLDSGHALGNGLDRAELGQQPRRPAGAGADQQPRPGDLDHVNRVLPGQGEGSLAAGPHRQATGSAPRQPRQGHEQRQEHDADGSEGIQSGEGERQGHGESHHTDPPEEGKFSTVGIVELPKPDPELLLDLLRVRMPFGKYEGLVLLDLPQPYLVWFAQKGFPKGKLGEQLALALEVKHNGLESMVRKLGR